MAPGLCHWLGFVYQIFCCDGCDAVDGIFELGCYKLYDTSSGPPLFVNEGDSPRENPFW